MTDEELDAIEADWRASSDNRFEDDVHDVLSLVTEVRALRLDLDFAIGCTGVEPEAFNWPSGCER